LFRRSSFTAWNSILLHQDGYYVFRTKADNKAEQIRVEVGDSFG